MLLVVLFLIVCLAVAIAVFIDHRWPFDMYDILAWIISVLAAAAFVTVSVVACINQIGADATALQNRQRYESLMYQAESSLYDNDNDVGKKELVNQIQSWNEDLAYHREVQDDLWIGFLYPDIYDKFDFIPVELVK